MSCDAKARSDSLPAFIHRSQLSFLVDSHVVDVETVLKNRFGFFMTSCGVRSTLLMDEVNVIYGKYSLLKGTYRKIWDIIFNARQFYIGKN